MNNIPTKTKRNIFIEAISIFLFFALSYAFKAYSLELNPEYIICQIDNSSVLKAYQDVKNPRSELEKYIKYDPYFKESLDRICENSVGKELIKLYSANNAASKEKLYIRTVSKGGAEFYVDAEGFGIKINTNHIDRYGNFKIATCGYDNGRIVAKFEALDTVLLHEICHAYHYVAGTHKGAERQALLQVYDREQENKRLWSNDEEVRTISGLYYDNGKLTFDPINENMYEFFKSVQYGTPYLKRVFHWPFANFIDTKRYFHNPLYAIDKFLINEKQYILMY